MSDHARFMRRALNEARRGRTRPNPRVGAVLVSGAGEIVGVGHHARAGEAHAEVVALADAETRGEARPGHTLYVTLEPCNHHGRTPPCTDAILAAGVSRVVLGATDPTSHTEGSIERLQAAGVEVIRGVLERECEALVADFAILSQRGRPMVVLKAAVTLDGRMATRTGDSKWITGDAARADAHRLRDDHDAVLVGVGTVLADDPRLDVRHVEGVNPIRVVFDSALRTPTDANVIRSEGGETWIVHGPAAEPGRRTALAEAGAVLIEVPSVGPRGGGGIDLDAALRALGERELMRVMVEGGPTLHGALLDAGLADRAVVFVAPRIVGDASAPAFAAGRGRDLMAEAWALDDVVVTPLGRDTRIEGALRRAKKEP